MAAPFYTFMKNLVSKVARFSAVLGGLVLTLLALIMTISITGGAIAKLGHADWFIAKAPRLATWIQESGIRTIHGMYELIKFGIAFVIFAFLPIASLERAHAVVDVFTDFLPATINQLLITFWDIIFLMILVLITWRLYGGMERLYDRNVVSQMLKIPEWWGFMLAFIQMIIASAVSAFVVWQQLCAMLFAQTETPPSKAEQNVECI